MTKKEPSRLDVKAIVGIGLLVALVFAIVHLVAHPRKAIEVLAIARTVGCRARHWPPWRGASLTLPKESHLGHHAPIAFLQEETLREFGLVRDAYRLRRSNIRKLAQKVDLLMEDLGIDYWLEGGVLLGIHDPNTRDVLEYDADLDISMHYKEVERLHRAIEKAPDCVRSLDGKRLLLKDRGLIFEPKMPDTSLKWVLTDAETDVFCDIFVFRDASDAKGNPVLVPDGVWMWQCASVPSEWNGVVHGFQLPSEWVFPTERILAGPDDDRFGTRVPANVTACLRYEYGSDLTPRYEWSDALKDFGPKGKV